MRLIAYSAIAFLIFASPLKADVYAYISESNGKFDLLDITTGKSTFIGNGGSTFAGLAFGKGNSLLGVTNGVVGTSNLLSVDPSTGTSTTIGSTGINITGVTNLSDGSLFAVDRSDNLYSIDQMNGKSSLIGATGLPVLGADFYNSLASDGSHLYYTLGTGGSMSSLYTLNATTGRATLVGSTGVFGIGGSAFAGESLTSGRLYGCNRSRSQRQD